MPPKIQIGLLCATLSWFGMAALAAAQSLDDLTAALKDHPSLNALSFQVDANRERAIAATALPDPIVSLGINNFPIFDPSFSEFLPTNKAVGIRQEIPNRRGREASAGELRAIAERTDRIRVAQLAALKGELIALLHDRERIARQRDLAHARDAKYDELVDVVEAEIDAGRPAVFRLAEIEAERAEVARRLVNLDREAIEIDARLTDLLGFVPDTAAPPVIAIEWTGNAVDFHAVRIADAGVDVTKYAIDRAEADWRPNWGAQLTYQQREAGATFPGDDWVSGAVTFTIPLWAERGQKPRLRAAKSDRASAEMRYQAAARSTVARYAAEHAALRASQNSIEVLDDKISAVEDEIAAQITVYESGVGDYAPIIDGEIAILKLRAEIAAEEARSAAATSRLNALMVQS